MKFKPVTIYAYVTLAITMLLGYNKFPLILIVPIAFINTLVFSKLLRGSRKGAVSAGEPNPFVDGMYLFLQQIMLVIVFYVGAEIIVVTAVYLVKSIINGLLSLGDLIASSLGSLFG